MCLGVCACVFICESVVTRITECEVGELYIHTGLRGESEAFPVVFALVCEETAEVDSELT